MASLTARAAGAMGTLSVLIALAMSGCSAIEQESSGAETASLPASIAAAAAAHSDEVARQLVPRDCTRSVGVTEDDPQQSAAEAGSALVAALDNAAPGDVLCIIGGYYEARPQIEASGEEGAPIVIRGFEGATVAGFDVRADYVRLAGFTIWNGPLGEPGIAIRGVGVEVDHNLILEPGGDGVACDRSEPACENVLIANNIIDGADGSGVVVYGTGVSVEGNEITGSVRRQASDADGIRFFGSDHVIRGNRIHDIFDRGYAGGDGPHTDCFQTFDESDSPTRDVLIEANVCRNVDHQCLIATATAARESGQIGRSRNIDFVNNVCDTNGSQAILVSEFPDVLVGNNLFLGEIEFQAVAALESSTGLRVINNIMLGRYAPYELTDDSREGFMADHNLYYDAEIGPPPDGWHEPSGQWGVDPQLDALGATDPRRRYAVARTSPAIDRGAFIEGITLDLLGNPRVVDGDSDGDTRSDIGPIEIQPVAIARSGPSP